MSLLEKQNPCGCAESHEDVNDFLNKLVDDVYTYRDTYFEQYSIDEAINKYTGLQNLVDKTVEIFNKHEKVALETQKAYYYYLKGRLLNVFSTYSAEAESLISKAIKLDPKLVDAWNALGECYCKNGEVLKAKSCFEGALKEEKNKVALRNLSIILRLQGAEAPKELKSKTEQGLTYAKESVQLDPNDGISWSILGNAYLAFFFSVQQNPAFLKQSLTAYTHAEKFANSKYSSDLHYNKAVAYKYQEEFKLALETFEQASLYDPKWELPKTKGEQLLRYLQDVQDLVLTKGKLKPKKLQQILQTLNSKQLGPYAGGSYTSSSGQSVKLSEVAYDSLKSGLNEEKVILGKVICSVRNEENVPFTFCSMDKAGSLIVTTVFNLANGKGVIIGDSVAIPEPYLTDVDFSYKDKNFKFKLVRVETPVIMVVNGRKLGSNNVAGVQVSISSKFD